MAIGIFLWFKIAQSNRANVNVIEDPYSLSKTSAAWIITYSGNDYIINDFSINYNLSSTYSNTQEVFDQTIPSTTSSLSIIATPSYGTATTGLNASWHFAITYTYNSGNLIAYSGDTVEYQICITIPSSWEACATGTLTYTFTNSNIVLLEQNDAAVFNISNSSDTILIDVLANDSGTWRYIASLITSPFTGSALISWSLWEQKVAYTYNGSSQNSDISFSYQVCIHTDCSNATITISFTWEQTNVTWVVTGVNDTATFTIWSGSTIVINVLENDQWSWLFLSGITNYPVTWSMTKSGNTIIYTYSWSNINIWEQVTGQYQVCNTIMCDTATVIITFNDWTSVTANDDYRFYDLSWSNWIVSILITVLNNDYYGSELETGLAITSIVNTPTTGSAQIVTNNTQILYYYGGNDLSTGDTISFGYIVCSKINSNNCDNATVTLTFVDTRPPSEYCAIPWDEDQDTKNDCADSDCNWFVTTWWICQYTWEVTCNDGFDNDGDGFIDCTDSSCDNKTYSGTLICQSTEITCNDWFDNDWDGSIDCNDSNCTSASVCQSTGSIESCNNGVDDDNDWYIDCVDSWCNNQIWSWGTCQYWSETTCNDGFDNDWDGSIDCNDSNCNANSQCSSSTWSHEICNNNQDDDSDGKADCSDTDCNGQTGSGWVICQPNGETNCSDWKDNDVDWKADCSDSNCSTSSACQTWWGNSWAEICNNWIDDDTDWAADCFDVDCANNSLCLNVCWNGIVNTQEDCDDSNTSNNDGCNSSCKFELPNCNDVSYIFGINTDITKLTIATTNNLSSRSKIKSLTRWDNSSVLNNTNFPQSHSYTQLGTYQTEVQIQNNFSGSIIKICQESITIKSIPGCTDKEAKNYDPNATIDDESCDYSTNNHDCTDINFRVSEPQPDVGETVFFLRTLNSQITQIQFYAWAGTYEIDSSSPKEYSYTLPWVYNAQLIIKAKDKNTKTCNLTIKVGKKGCIYEDALNFNTDAEIDDGSCIFQTDNWYNNICWNTKLDQWEECDDGNNYNGDSCDSTCFLEEGRIPYCGNSIVEKGEECDGWPYCSDDCTYFEEYIIDEIRKEVCYLNGQCKFWGSNNFMMPEKLPNVWPDDERLNKKLKELWYTLSEKPNINTESLPRFRTLSIDDPHYKDPLYRIEHILPPKYLHYTKFFVAPSIGSVVAIKDIENPTELDRFILGKPIDIQDQLTETIVHYAGSAGIGKGGNTVLVGHSSQYQLPDQDKNNIGNAFKLLPLLEKDDVFYLVERVKGEYKTYTYTVTKKSIVNPSDAKILQQNNQGNKVTLLTCYPIGSSKQRLVVEAKPVSILIDIRYSDLLNKLSARQKIQLRSMAQKYKNNIQNERALNLLINQIHQTRLQIKGQADLNSDTKERMDSTLQYLIYELANTKI